MMMDDKEKKNKQKHDEAMARFKAMKQQLEPEEDSENDETRTSGILPDKSLKRNLGCG